MSKAQQSEVIQRFSLRVGPRRKLKTVENAVSKWLQRASYPFRLSIRQDRVLTPSGRETWVLIEGTNDVKTVPVDNTQLLGTLAALVTNLVGELGIDGKEVRLEVFTGLSFEIL